MQEKMKLVSVIIPVYKVEKYLDKCVQSVVEQSYGNLEIILVDDGSPDGCPAMCDNWAKRDDRIKVVHKANGGLSDARNAGLDVATGEYVTFLDSDDWVAKNFVETCLENTIKYDSDVTCIKYKIVYTRGNYESGGTGEVKLFDKKDDIISLIWADNNAVFHIAWGKLYKKSIFNGLRFKVGRINEDEFICPHILHRANKYVYIDKEMLFYYQRPDSIMHGKFTRKRLDGYEACKEQNSLIKENYPHLACQANNLFMGQIRFVYFNSKRAKLGKDVLIQLKQDFNRIYKETQPKKMLNRLFYTAPWIYCMLYGVVNRMRQMKHRRNENKDKRFKK